MIGLFQTVVLLNNLIILGLEHALIRFSYAAAAAAGFAQDLPRNEIKGRL